VTQHLIFGKIPKLIIFVFLIVVTASIIFFYKFAQLDTYAEGSSVIDSITDNRNSYPNGKIPKYEKIEITFEVKLSSATNYFYPYDNSPPSGIIPKTGINVDAIFTSPDGTLYKQPGFYYQEFLDQVKSGKEWFYPTENYKWKVRFSPNKEGTWKYKLKAIDSSGTVESQEQTFNVMSSKITDLSKLAAIAAILNTTTELTFLH